MNDQPARQVGDSNQQITITLPLGAWTEVLGCIAEAPFKRADPLFREINRQLGNALAPPQLGH